MRSFFSLSLILGLGLLLSSSSRGADDKKSEEPPAPVKPGKEHQLLKQMEGSWEALIKTPGEPGKGAMEFKGSETCKLSHNGLWLIEDFKADLGGQPFTGHGVYGYDPAKKKYVGVWVDSMQDFLGQNEGQFDSSGKVWTMTMDSKDPSGKAMKIKMVTEFKDKDHHTFTMSAPGEGGKEMAIMTIEYTRKAKK